MALPLLILTLVLTAVSVGGVIYCLGCLTQQVQYVILADGRRQERSLPVLIRAALPFAALTPNFVFAGPWKAGAARLDRKILSAGFDGLVTGRELMLAQLWLGGVGLAFGLLLGRGINVVALILAIGLFAYPRMWLKGALAARAPGHPAGPAVCARPADALRRGGARLHERLSKIVDRRRMDALGEELMRVFHIIKLGRTRRQALREMRDRCGPARPHGGHSTP